MSKVCYLGMTKIDALGKEIRTQPFSDPFKIFIVAEHFYLAAHIIGGSLREAIGKAPPNAIFIYRTH